MKRTDIVHRIAETMHRIAPTARTILYGSLKRVWENITTPLTLNINREGIVL